MSISRKGWRQMAPHLAHLYPDEPMPGATPMTPPKRSKTNALGQNKTEALFDVELEQARRDGLLRWFGFEPVRFILAGNTAYRLDFLAQRADGSMCGFEVKGFMRDDAAVKIKVAAAQAPWLDLYLVRRMKREWDVRRVTRTGIDRRTIPLRMAIEGVQPL